MRRSSIRQRKQQLRRHGQFGPQIAQERSKDGQNECGHEEKRKDRRRKQEERIGERAAQRFTQDMGLGENSSRLTQYDIEPPALLPCPHHPNQTRRECLRVHLHRL